MTAFALGQVAIGGGREYIEIIEPDGSFVQLLHQIDDMAEGEQFITGLTYRVSTGELFTACTPSLTAPYAPHDIDCFPSESGLLVAVVPTAGQLEFRKYSFAGAVLATWHPGTEYGWAAESTKISIACDNRTVFYTQSLHRIMRYDLITSTQLPDYETLPLNSPYIYGGVKVLPGDTGDNIDVLVAMSLTGNGPRRSLCLDASRFAFWTDEVNPTSQYHVYKRDTEAGTQLLSVVTRADPVPDNDKTYALACYYRGCVMARRGWVWVND